MLIDFYEFNLLSMTCKFVYQLIQESWPYHTESAEKIDFR